MKRRFGISIVAALIIVGVALTVRAVLPGPEAAAAQVGARGDTVQPTPSGGGPVDSPVDAALARRAVAENEERARVAAFLAAVAEYYRPKTGVNWDGIARCETGGNWSMQGSRYSGGLGFYNGTWSSFGGGEFASNAGLATREQQIVVAERVYARHGLSGWGCKAYG